MLTVTGHIIHIHTDNSSDYIKVLKAFRESFKAEIVADETFVSEILTSKQPYKIKDKRI